MEKFLDLFAPFLLLCLLYLPRRIAGDCIRTRIYKHVKWCIGGRHYFGSPQRHASHDNILDSFCDHYLLDELKIAEHHQLAAKEEVSIAAKIITQYQTALVQRYFFDAPGLSLFSWNNARLSDEEFFMASISTFLWEHWISEEYTFVPWSDHPDCIFDSSKKLTDYGKVYLKLAYIAAIYCEQSKPIQKRLRAGLILKRSVWPSEEIESVMIKHK